MSIKAFQEENESPGMLLAIDVAGIGLGRGHDHDVVQTDVSGTGHGKKDRVGNIFARKGHHPVVHVFGSLFVTFVANDGKFRFHHSRCDVCHFHVVFQHIHPDGFRECIHGMFRGAVDIATGIDLLAGDGAEVHDVAVVAGNHQRGHFPGDVEQPFHVGVNHAFPIVQNPLLDGIRPHGQPGVVYEDINLFPCLW